MLSDLRLTRQAIEFFERPSAGTLDQARDIELIVGCLDFRRFRFRIKTVEGKRPGDIAFGKTRRELRGIEKTRLHLVIETRHGAKQRLDRIARLNVAAGEHDECAEARSALQEPAARGWRHEAERVFDDFARVRLRDEIPAHDCSPSTDHGADSARDQKRHRYMHEEKQHEPRHGEKMDKAGALKAAHQIGETG